MWLLQNAPGIIFVSEKYKTAQSLSYISFKIAPLCKYTLLPATVKLLETFLEAILWKHFQLFRHIFNEVSSVTKAPFIQCWLQSSEQVKLSCNQLWNPWPKPTCLLEHCREGGTVFCFSVLRYVKTLKHAEEKRAKNNKKIGEGGKKNIWLLQCPYVPPSLPSRKVSTGNEPDTVGRAV